ncbi:stage II sporulation protein M [Marinoscillum sp.]|uniref:stage II sporulation protein M n=1 Tax=Marinoscillum sp. TaxID=2024838 RepID=UPI003BA8B9E7
MRQGLFVKVNEDKWLKFEKKLEQIEHLSADELSEIYVHLTEDLAFARAKYADSDLVVYLNGLTLKVHNVIYRNKPEKTNRLVTFWTMDLPEVLHSSRKYLVYALLIFSVGIAIGALSAANDQTFVRLILGDQYVNMTLKNIENGDPMAVYKQASEGVMFLGITVNNIKVSLLAFAMGIFFSLGTGYILFTNGVMVGAFHYLFVQNGLFDETIMTIWVHGTLELSAIVFAGGAGLVMGHSLLFPGTYPRGYSFRKGAKEGLKIVLSLVPFFIVAGFLEGFATRHTEWPFFLKLLIIAISALVVVFYTFVLPNLHKYVRKEHSAVQAA